MRQRRWIGGVAALVVLAVLVGAVVARKSGQPKDDKPKEATLTFTTQEVVQPQSMALPGKVTFSGPLVAPSTVTVRAKAAGTLVSLRVDEGSRVSVGESLGVIDLAELNARLNEKTAQAEAAKALLAQAQRSHDSNLGLAEQKFISPIALENSRASLESAKAQLEAINKDGVIDETKLEPVIAARIKQATGPLERSLRDAERKIEAANKTVAEREQEIGRLNTSITTTSIESRLRDAAFAFR